MEGSTEVGLPVKNPYMLPLLRPALGVPPRRGGKSPTTETDSVSASSVSATTDNSRQLRPLRIEELTALFTLQAPAPQFQGKFHLDTQHIDLKWLFTRPIRPPATWLTLANMREDLLLSPTKSAAEALQRKEMTLLNSPRSVLTMLRNGVAVEEMQERSSDQYFRDGGLEGLPVYAIQKRIQYRENKRRRDLARLREEYQYYAKQMPMETILTFFDLYDNSMPSALSENPIYVEEINAENRGEKGIDHSVSTLELNGSQAARLEESVSLDPTSTSLSIGVDLSPVKASSSRSVQPLPALVPSTSPRLKAETPKFSPGTLQQSPATDPHPLPKANLLQPINSPKKALSVSGSLTSQPTSLHPLDSWVAKKLEDNRQRIEMHLTTDLAVRERAIEMRRIGIETSAQREIQFEQRMKQRKSFRDKLIADHAAALRANTEKHQLRAQRKFIELEERVQQNAKRKQDTEQARLEFVEALKEQKRQIASKNKEKRLEKLQSTLQRQAQLEEEHIIHFEKKQREERLRIDEALVERQKRQERLRDEAFEKAAQRLFAQQRGAVIAVERRMEAEDRQERTSQRVDNFIEQKLRQEAQQKISDELRAEKRQRVLDTAQAIVERHREETLTKQESFEERWSTLQEQRKVNAEITKEVLRLRVRDKVEYRDRARNALEFEKLCVIDNIQRKIDKIDRTNSTKGALLREMKWDYEERKRDRDRVVQQMEQTQISNEKEATFHIFNQPPLD